VEVSVPVSTFPPVVRPAVRPVVIRAASTSGEPDAAPPNAAANSALDPDRAFQNTVNLYRGLALTRGIQGFVGSQLFYTSLANATQATWTGLQLNPLTARFYDGQI
jgi:hypothetical protein